jgi:hypothetical protein
VPDLPLGLPALRRDVPPPPENVRVETYGNVPAATASLQGLAADELARAELDHVDPRFEVLIAVRAVKAGPEPSRAGCLGGNDLLNDPLSEIGGGDLSGGHAHPLVPDGRSPLRGQEGRRRSRPGGPPPPPEGGSAGFDGVRP